MAFTMISEYGHQLKQWWTYYLKPMSFVGLVYQACEFWQRHSCRVSIKLTDLHRAVISDLNCSVVGKLLDSFF